MGILTKKKFGIRNTFLSRAIKWLLRALLAIVAAVIVYGLIAVFLAFVPVNRDFQPDPEGIEIFLITNGVHLDICVPSQTSESSWLDFFENGSFSPPPSGYVSFGWGERNFYLYTPTWADLTVSTALHASLWPSASAMHVTSYRSGLKNGEYVRSVRISPETYQKLIERIQESFARDEQGKIQPIDCCNYAGERDKFFEARGSYHLFHTCNDWVNTSLKQAGIRTAVWSPFDWGVLRYFE